MTDRGRGKISIRRKTLRECGKREWRQSAVCEKVKEGGRNAGEISFISLIE